MDETKGEGSYPTPFAHFSENTYRSTEIFLPACYSTSFSMNEVSTVPSRNSLLPMIRW